MCNLQEGVSVVKYGCTKERLKRQESSIKSVLDVIINLIVLLFILIAHPQLAGCTLPLHFDRLKTEPFVSKQPVARFTGFVLDYKALNYIIK